MRNTVLLVDDDPHLLRLVEHHLSLEGINTITATTGADAHRLIKNDEPAAVLLDIGLPDISGVRLLRDFRECYPSIPVVMLTVTGDVENVVECMRLGALDFVQKPFDEARLVTSVRNALDQAALKKRVESLTSELRGDEGFACIIGESPPMTQVLALLARAARTDVTVLLMGETGTGKELAARAIHAESKRRSGPFVPVNCGAMPSGLIESELFGHEKGAFTGATAKRRGSFEQADGGTIFLDEIAELGTDLQSRLLRVVDDKWIQRVGASVMRNLDIRIITATNQDLSEGVARGEFRPDLYYRLSVFPVVLPPLRARKGDIPALADSFIRYFAARHGRQVYDLTTEALRAMERYPWAGNVRELQHVIERAVILEETASISLESLPDEVVGALDNEDDTIPAAGGATSVKHAAWEQATPGARVGTGRAWFDQRTSAGADGIVPFEEEERRIISRALDLTNWDIRQAARRLGIGRATIYRKIERYGLKRRMS